MRVLPILMLFFFALVAGGGAIAQDSLSIRDASEIRYKAERMVKTELNELLNSLSNTSYETQEVAESIHSSFSESRNRIFRDSMVLVEPDINPAFQNSGQSGEEPVEKYLRDIDLLYKKSDSPTVEFNNIRSSPVKKKEQIYVKVYFNSLFKGRSSVSSLAFVPTNRLAEIKAEKDRNQWRLFIVRLAFFNPADTASDVTNNVPLRHEMGLPRESSGQSRDSASAMRQQLSFDEEQSEKMTAQLREQERMDDERYKRLLVLGDKAYRQKDFTVALRQYKEAQDLRPNSPEVNIRLRNTSNAMNEFRVESGQLYAGFMEKARLQENNRQYREAIESYRNAIQQKPDESANLQPRIRALTDKFVILADLQEKFNAGYVKEALREYTDAIKKDPGNSDYYLGRARCHERLTDEPKNLALALKDYSQAYELDHNNLQAIRSRAELYARTGEYFKALSDYKVYLTVDRNNMETYERMSAMHVALKLYPEAVADLDRALAIDPQAAQIYIAKGLLLYNQKELEKARESFSICLRIDSSNALALFNRGRCEILQNKLPEAGTDFAKARAKGLDSGDCLIIGSYAARYYEQAIGKVSAKDPESAMTYIDYAIQLEPASPLYWFTRGNCYYALGRSKEAISSYDQAIRYDPAYPQAYYRRGLACVSNGDYKGAIASFESSSKLDPKNMLAEKGRADAYKALKDYSAASTSYENAIRVSAATKPPTDPWLVSEMYASLADCYLQQGLFARAEANGKKAIANQRNLAAAYFITGSASYRLGLLPEAIDNLEKAIALDNQHADWHYLLGCAYQDKKDPRNAVAQFAACSQQDKDLTLPEAIYREGYCFYAMENYPNALPFYKRSLVLHLDSGKASFDTEMGTIYLNTGKYDSAYYYCKKAFQRDSTNGYACYGIGSSLALQGKADESIPWFERSFRMRTPGYAEIKKDRLLAEMRNNRKFKELLKKYF